MRTILIVACFFVVAGIAMAKMADRLTPAAGSCLDSISISANCT